MAVTARPADRSDIPSLVSLDEALRETLADQRGGSVYLLRNHRRRPTERSYAHDVEATDKIVVIGEIDGVAVGFAVAALKALEGDYTLAEITEIFVDADMRDVGVGAAMMSAVIDWARHNGADGLDSQAMPGDRDTKNFFESNGLVARAIYVHKDLTEE